MEDIYEDYTGNAVFVRMREGFPIVGIMHADNEDAFVRINNYRRIHAMLHYLAEDIMRALKNED
ncbi:hypothetical protein KY316_01855, partial [Candidatus Woesearchaeota archaeon]|nr:hypothetical protein [Candidatus Woesearchaeota archaeon]